MFKNISLSKNDRGIISYSIIVRNIEFTEKSAATW